MNVLLTFYGSGKIDLGVTARHSVCQWEGPGANCQGISPGSVSSCSVTFLEVLYNLNFRCLTCEMGVIIVSLSQFFFFLNV